MAIAIPGSGSFDAFAIIVDINGFTRMVSHGDDTGLMAQFIRDVLSGSIRAIEDQGGAVVGFMGDAVLGVLPPTESIVLACFAIAKDLDGQCEYISVHQQDFPRDWEYAPGGPSLKISIEYGDINVSTIYSSYLGQQTLLIGNAINYASRISAGGVGNRCNIGPTAASMAPFTSYALAGPYTIGGKHAEPPYTYYEFGMGDIWREGHIKQGHDTYWG